jgi:hypothetical protein
MASSTRANLLRFGAEFRSLIAELKGIERVALIGSLCTDKAEPNDIDFVVTLKPGTDIGPLARVSRRLKGRAQQINRGADIFLVEEGQYIGRICHYRQCHPRVLCRALHCGLRDHLNDDLGVLRLRQDLITDPPLEIWPNWKARDSMPKDTIAAFQEELVR